jgi:hypothetical protein
MLAIGGIAVVGGLVRLAALIRTGGPLGFYVDYDEGVYSSAATELSRGNLPYHDFVFVHPPGILYVLTPLGLLGPARALVAGRVLAVGFGVLSICILGYIC